MVGRTASSSTAWTKGEWDKGAEFGFRALRASARPSTTRARRIGSARRQRAQRHRAVPGARDALTAAGVKSHFVTVRGCHPPRRERFPRLMRAPANPSPTRTTHRRATHRPWRYAGTTRRCRCSDGHRYPGPPARAPRRSPGTRPVMQKSSVPRTNLHAVLPGVRGYSTGRDCCRPMPRFGSGEPHRRSTDRTITHYGVPFSAGISIVRRDASTGRRCSRVDALDDGQLGGVAGPTLAGIARHPHGPRRQLLPVLPSCTRTHPYESAKPPSNPGRCRPRSVFRGSVIWLQMGTLDSCRPLLGRVWLGTAGGGALP